MSGLARKLVIFAAVDGLILQAHGPQEYPKELQIDYQSRTIRPRPAQERAVPRPDPHLEVHGIVGLLSVASSSFLISITRREQVAQIFGKPIFVIKEIALLPLASQQDASQAIGDVLRSHRNRAAGHDSSDESDVEANVEPPTPTDTAEGNPPAPPRASDSPRIAQHVITKQGLYGGFASQWLFKAAWVRRGDRQDAATPSTPSTGPPVPTSTSVTDTSVNPVVPPNETPAPSHNGEDARTSQAPARVALVPNVMRSTKMILGSSSMYFSYDVDLTHALRDKSHDKMKFVSHRSLDDRFFWNRFLCSAFLESGTETFAMPIMQGFVGQRTFAVRKGHTEAVTAAEAAANETDATMPPPATDATSDGSQTFLLTLISRRSTKRSGLRYLRRGIDDQGSCANSVETEQILSLPSWDGGKAYSYLQIRGSIPLYFSQRAYALKPLPVLHQSPTQNQTAMARHFDDLHQRYGGVQAALLVNKHGVEAPVGQAYEDAVRLYNQTHEAAVGMEWFDFHEECRGMKFENVEKLVKTLAGRITDFGETVVDDGVVTQKQLGIIRTNCMDCLDRTNVAQSAFAQFILQQALRKEGYDIDLLHDEKTQWFNTLWADNGDAISRQYAGTAALKGDFTRTRKRNYRGALNDLGLTLNRYYNNMINDYFSQAVIDVLLGHVSSSVFDDFESTMMSKDPGISLNAIRETAIENCRKIVIQSDEEDLVRGWTMLAPAQVNTLRTMPLDEVVVLLTDAAIYCCKYDWDTEKVHSFQKIDLRSVKKIRYGTYITSTLTDQQMREHLNVGLVIESRSDQGSMVRVNTRSLQSHVPDDRPATDVDGGTGLMSWMGARGSTASHMTALKLVTEQDDATKPSESPLQAVESIVDEMRRAMTGRSPNDKQPGVDVVEKGDIISLAEAKKRTGYIEQLSHSVKKLVWT